MEKEKFKFIRDTQGQYLISNFGTVISLKYGRVRHLKYGYDGDGYPNVSLSMVGVVRTYHVHKLVATHFVNNPHNKTQINHIDGNPKNPNYSNLEWCTQKENFEHAKAMGLWDGDRRIKEYSRQRGRKKKYKRKPKPKHHH